jgi:hypothetical protein
MAWEIEVTDEYRMWYFGLTRTQKQDLDARIEMLEQDGPHLRRPYVGEIVSSRYPNMKELRCSSEGAALRVLFAFDPRRTAILLLGGDKTGAWEEWYAVSIPLAENIYEQYLKEIEEEGLV